MTDLAAERRKLCFRAWHRGTREADLLLGRFADGAVPNWTAPELALFAAFLEENDPDIYNWVTGQEPAPARYRELVAAIAGSYA